LLANIHIITVMVIEIKYDDDDDLSHAVHNIFTAMAD